MAGSPRINGRILSLLRTRTVKKRTIVIGLKSDNNSREMLLRLLTQVVMPGDNVLAVHVQEPNDAFDPNTFHLHEDLCKSKQVDFEVKVCVGSSYMIELSHQVRVKFATVLAIGCSSTWPKDSKVSKYLKALPPTCSLLVVDNGGRILVQRQGTSQEGSAVQVLQSPPSSTPRQGSGNKFLQSSLSAIPKYTSYDRSGAPRQIQKSLTLPSSSSTSSSSSSIKRIQNTRLQSVKKTMQLPDFETRKLFEKLATLEANGFSRRFTTEDLKSATHNFSPELLIGEGGHSNVFRANLDNGQTAAVKVLKPTRYSDDDLFRELEMLSGLKHENIVTLIGYCCSKDMLAVVYNLLKVSLKNNLKQIRWSDRMKIAVGVAKALDYLHSLSPPIIHRDVKSSNILLSDHCEPQLSDFGAATALQQQIQQVSSYTKKPIHVVGTFGYMAPEYIMYGKVDEKIDVYSYGVVLLELITGKEAIQTNQSCNHESLVLWARSLLSCDLCERLVDPFLNENYNKDEMKTLMIAARLCLLHSSSRRPSMKMILRLFEEPEHWLNVQRKREELLHSISSKAERALCRFDDLDSNETLLMDDN